MYLVYTQELLLIAGLLAVGVAALAWAAGDAYQLYQGWMFDGALSRENARTESPNGAPSNLNPALIGKLAVPRLGISAMVMEGVDDATLDLAVGHIPDTALPGQPGNVGVAAHRDTHFRKLKDIQRDDEITLTTIGGKYVYRVISYRVVAPTEVSVLDPSANQNTITLVTCYPFYFVGHAPKRFIVRARQIAALSPGAV
jgi:sortase A